MEEKKKVGVILKPSMRISRAIINEREILSSFPGRRVSPPGYILRLYETLSCTLYYVTQIDFRRGNSYETQTDNNARTRL